MKRTCLAFVAIAALSAAGIASAHGHRGVSIGFGFPLAPPVYMAPPPVYYVQPRVVYVAPPPMYYQPAYVYYAPPPVTVYRQAPRVVYERSERTEVVPARPQPEPVAPALPPRAYRN
jgi:hypothetical protein